MNCHYTVTGKSIRVEQCRVYFKMRRETNETIRRCLPYSIFNKVSENTIDHVFKPHHVPDN